MIEEAARNKKKRKKASRNLDQDHHYNKLLGSKTKRNEGRLDWLSVLSAGFVLLFCSGRSQISVEILERKGFFKLCFHIQHKLFTHCIKFKTWFHLSCSNYAVKENKSSAFKKNHVKLAFFPIHIDIITAFFSWKIKSAILCERWLSTFFTFTLAKCQAFRYENVEFVQVIMIKILGFCNFYMFWII